MIDQSTGLPIIDPSGIIQQIPLGLPVVPFADLNALGRPTRAPIYPDDFIPTVSMLVGQDDKGAARAGTMDSERNLWTRDVQLQSYGKTLEDGTSGPIDVNIAGASGGGLGGSPYTIDVTQSGVTDAKNYRSFELDGQGQNETTLIGNLRYLTGVDVTMMIKTATLSAHEFLELYVYAEKDRGDPSATTSIAVWSTVFAGSTLTGAQAAATVSKAIMFNPPIDLYSSLGVTDGFYWYYGLDTRITEGYLTHVFYGYH